jgi:hypothetical protein
VSETGGPEPATASSGAPGQLFRSDVPGDGASKVEARTRPGTRERPCDAHSSTCPADDERLLAMLLARISGDKVPLRPGRMEPRRVKRRPKNYSRLTKPRSVYRQKGDTACRLLHATRDCPEWHAEHAVEHGAVIGPLASAPLCWEQRRDAIEAVVGKLVAPAGAAVRAAPRSCLSFHRRPPCQTTASALSLESAT